MTRYESRTQVGGGYYFNTTSWSLHAVDGERGELPGEMGTRWVRLPTVVMIAAAAVFSLAFVLFLPVVGLGLFAWVVGGAIVRKLGHFVVRAVEAFVHLFAPQWRPGEAWLTRHEPTPTAGPAPEATHEELKNEVETRRAAEELSEKK
ncbi:MAG: hypothetical protein Q8L48_31475 [Archangium sp.]|nr:hypothetical protein [Archangium sp.]